MQLRTANSPIFASHEYVGVARYHFYNAMGWNAPKLPEEIPTTQTPT